MPRECYKFLRYDIDHPPPPASLAFLLNLSNSALNIIVEIFYFNYSHWNCDVQVPLKIVISHTKVNLHCHSFFCLKDCFMRQSQFHMHKVHEVVSNGNIVPQNILDLDLK